MLEVRILLSLLCLNQGSLEFVVSAAVVGLILSFQLLLVVKLLIRSPTRLVALQACHLLLLELLLLHLVDELGVDLLLLQGDRGLLTVRFYDFLFHVDLAQSEGALVGACSPGGLGLGHRCEVVSSSGACLVAALDCIRRKSVVREHRSVAL